MRQIDIDKQQYEEQNAAKVSTLEKLLSTLSSLEAKEKMNAQLVELTAALQKEKEAHERFKHHYEKRRIAQDQEIADLKLEVARYKTRLVQVTQLKELSSEFELQRRKIEETRVQLSRVASTLYPDQDTGPAPVASPRPASGEAASSLDSGRQKSASSDFQQHQQQLMRIAELSQTHHHEIPLFLLLILATGLLFIALSGDPVSRVM